MFVVVVCSFFAHNVFQAAEYDTTRLYENSRRQYASSKHYDEHELSALEFEQRFSSEPIFRESHGGAYWVIEQNNIYKTKDIDLSLFDPVNQKVDYSNSGGFVAGFVVAINFFSMWFFVFVKWGVYLLAGRFCFLLSKFVCAPAPSRFWFVFEKFGTHSEVNVVNRLYESGSHERYGAFCRSCVSFISVLSVPVVTVLVALFFALVPFSSIFWFMSVLVFSAFCFCSHYLLFSYMNASPYQYRNTMFIKAWVLSGEAPAEHLERCLTDFGFVEIPFDCDSEVLLGLSDTSLSIKEVYDLTNAAVS